MEKLITQNGGYKVYAQFNKVEKMDDIFALKFLTEWDDANNMEKQQKFIMFLNDEQRKVLKELL